MVSWRIYRSGRRWPESQLRVFGGRSSNLPMMKKRSYLCFLWGPCQIYYRTESGFWKRENCRNNPKASGFGITDGTYSLPQINRLCFFRNIISQKLGEISWKEFVSPIADGWKRPYYDLIVRLSFCKWKIQHYLLKSIFHLESRIWPFPGLIWINKEDLWTQNRFDLTIPKEA